MIILPTIKCSSQRHPVIRFCRHLRLWSKPTLDDAEMTASLIGGVLWFFFATAALLFSRDFVITAAIIGTTDHIGRILGIRSYFIFIPIWVYAYLACALFWGIPKA